MKNNRSKIITIALILMTLVLMVLIFYIGYILTSSPADNQNSFAPKKTKAQVSSNSKFVALGDTENPTPTIMESYQVTPQLTPTLVLLAPATTVSPIISPTDSILAKAGPTSVSATPNPSTSKTATTSATPTKTLKLPQTGSVVNSLIMFAGAGILIFFAFLF